MPAFEYEALDATGKRSRGLITADSEVAARRALRRRALAPLKIGQTSKRETRGDRAGGGISLRRTDLSHRELMLVSRQLASLIEAGMPVEEAVGLVGQQADKLHMRRVLLSVRSSVTEGERLSEALAAHRGSFPPVYRAMVAAGESAGGLGAVMNRLADYLEKSDAIRRKIQGAMVYPAFLGLVAIGVVWLLMTMVVPRIAEQFEGTGVALPALTRVMIGLSGFLAASWPFLLAGLAVAILLYAVAIRSDAFRKQRDRGLNEIPGFGGFRKKAEAARFARTVSILLTSGAILPDALRAARRASTDLVFQDAAGAVLKDVETGKSLSDALRARKYFPPLMVYMVAAGERSGALGEMFGRAADQLDQEIDGAVTTGLSLLEPAIIVIMGVVVTTIVLSILMPILQLNTLVG